MKFEVNSDILSMLVSSFCRSFSESFVMSESTMFVESDFAPLAIIS